MWLGRKRKKKTYGKNKKKRYSRSDSVRQQKMWLGRNSRIYEQAVP
jgi:hypothetical protein